MDKLKMPATEQAVKASPSEKQTEKAMPVVTDSKKDLPDPRNAMNCIVLGDEIVEIKPTKLKYHRNRTALFYRYVETTPLPDLLGLKKGTFGDDRDGDKAMFDWLIAVFNDADLVKRHYDEMDTDTIEQILSVFRRVNRIDEREENLKNAEKNLIKGG